MTPATLREPVMERYELPHYSCYRLCPELLGDLV